MDVDDDQAWWLLLMVIGAFLLGLAVYITNDKYRIEENLKSNQDYYSHVDAESS